MMTQFKISLSLILSLAAASPSFAVETVESREKRMEWWHDAHFGMFVHWGLYSIPAGKWGDYTRKRGGVEWIQKMASVPADEYEKTLIPQFKPKKDFAKEWAGLAKTAGCRYLVFTSKHHEGFALHDSKLTTFDAKDACGRDLVKEITDATRAEGLKVGLYHSLIDWHHPQSYAGFGLATVKGSINKGRDNSKYVDYLHGQVRELVTGYGDIDVIWWDYSMPKCQGEKWRSDDLIALVRKHQPNVILNNRLYASKGGIPPNWKNEILLDPKYGDYCTPEQHIPKQGEEGLSWESCMTINTSWGYNQFDHNWKSSDRLIKNLVDVVSKGGNYLLNIGPMADGSIPQETIKRMTDIGKWMDSYGDSIYGTTASQFKKLPWGRSTTKIAKDGSTILYLHVLDWPKDGKLVVPGLKNAPAKAELLSPTGAKKLSFKQTGNDLALTVPASAIDPHVSVIALVFEDAPEIIR